MPIADAAREWTADEVRALPDDGNRYEVVDGELLVTPSPALPHQAALFAIAIEVQRYVRANGIGTVFLAPADVSFGARTMVQPDLFVVAHPPGARPNAWTDVGVPLLAVEVLSPSTARSDRFRKRVLYQREGVAEYWIVDLDARYVERWRPGDERPEVLDARLEWQPRAELPPLVVDLEAVFREAWGE